MSGSLASIIRTNNNRRNNRNDGRIDDNKFKEATLYPDTYRIPASKDLKKSEVIYCIKNVPQGINKHIDALIFIISHRDGRAREAFEVLWDTYLQSICSFDYEDFREDYYARLEIYARDSTVFEAIKKHGLTLNGMVHRPITPTPPIVHIWKANFRYIPHYYSMEDIVEFFSEYGFVQEIGMYYMDSRHGRVFTQDGYVHYAQDSKERSMRHQPLPEQVDVGAKKPIAIKIAGQHYKREAFLLALVSFWIFISL
ncbi:hypothetical protein BGW39_007459 [Mortierella sp. 14UC]|nr:hypothetical protein BGW39_007459 [Mortierella sp. 14UC]